MTPGRSTVPEYCLPKDQILPERLRFAEALAAAVRQVETLQGKTANLPAEVSEELGYLLDAHLQMLKGSRLVRGVERRITEDRINAEAAVQQEIGQIADSFAAMDDAYLASRVDDIREVGLRLVRNLTKTPFKPFSNMPANAVVLAEELSPADTALLNPAEVAGMATVLGGAAGHTAIMARSLGLPSVVGIAGVLAGVRTGMPVIIDGTAGAVILNPSRETLKLYRVKRADLLRERRRLDRMGKVPAVTLDGTRHHLAGQSGASRRDRCGDGQWRRRHRPVPQRIHVYEPRRPALGRGAISVDGRIGARAWTGGL